MEVRKALARAGAALDRAGIPGPFREARLMLAHAQGRDPRAVPEPGLPVPDSFWAMVERRRAREPLALIVGRQGFWTLDLEVSRDTLIPRADSEALVEAALQAFPDRRALRRALDLGTGTGALLLAVLSECPEAFGVGIDISPAACALAARNARALGLSGRTMLAAGNWAACLDGPFDLVLANPPYVASAAIAGLMPEVSIFEPAWALDGGADGLDAYRIIVPDLPRLLGPTGVAVLEVGQGQEDPVAAMLAATGLTQVGVRKDLGGISRAVIGYRSQDSKKLVGSGGQEH